VSQKTLIYSLAGLAAVALAVVGYFVFLGNSSGNSDATTQSGERYAIQVTPDDRTMGSPKAPLTLLEYAAPSCPHCAHFDKDFFPQLKQQYIDTGKVFYIFRVFPLGDADLAAESIARCVPADNYFSFIDLLFRNQDKWDPENQVSDVRAGLVQVGRIAGMSDDQVNACMSNQAALQKAAKIGEEANTKYGVSTTPTFIANGQVHGPFADWNDVKSFLDPMLAKK
jgi:protein-disulfide isomerase